jgi:hypothetical protein
MMAKRVHIDARARAVAAAAANEGRSAPAASPGTAVPPPAGVNAVDAAAATLLAWAAGIHGTVGAAIAARAELVGDCSAEGFSAMEAVNEANAADLGSVTT